MVLSVNSGVHQGAVASDGGQATVDVWLSKVGFVVSEGASVSGLHQGVSGGIHHTNCFVVLQGFSVDGDPSSVLLRLLLSTLVDEGTFSDI